MKKYIIIILMIVLGAFFIIYIVSCIPKQIDIVYPAVEYNTNNMSYEEKTSIKIQGKLYNKLFSRPTFYGRLIIDKYDMTKDYELIQLIFGAGLENQGFIYYTATDGFDADLQYFGTIFISKNFKTLNIQINDDTDRQSGQNLFISAPAKTREEAEEIFKALHP